MLPRHIALVSLSTKLTPTQLSQTSAALQKQATRDLGPIWGIEATVDYFPDVKSIPLGYWPIIIMDKLNDPGAAGYHTDKNNQPFSLVELDETWQLTCSHEMCEMLVDPYGNHTISAGSLEPSQGKVEYLVEVCDPCEDASFAYSINGILVSDFYTPNYFDPQAVPGVRYSYTGAISKPCEVLKNGYLSWQDPVSKQWYQGNFFGQSLAIAALNGMRAYGKSLRSQIDRLTKNPNSHKAYKAAARKHQPQQVKIVKAATSKSNDWNIEIAKFAKELVPNAMQDQNPPSPDANLDVTFSNPSGVGIGSFDATLFRGDGTSQSASLDSNGGRIVFNNVSSGDAINITIISSTQDTVEVTINRNTNPSTPIKYTQVTEINDAFQILQP
jgi:hypothetical protein